ncbi:hypothetical protein A6M27_12075 [Acidithiobacillus thiooxidans]|uniref:Uncharacterized protein n=1 Tax=Acidithiobacillus thiooxidans TaxID=930 RepID=A0A1C2JEP5_ACITH|nr:hypothetical protein [Acidithiobacillus thiooxidans]OCX70060.1 hypothetical protein A6P07_15415 [Acidithiobacillus thiooxidans]OCX71727.1 hypothetical protein A6O24_15150 [Acidithiobacillus thiooxidans]OCX78867.1 hypothetical protein A6O26_17525 [Acidithiobacillus thiooxidans]OCX86654.1 hypothetical protein A6M27_12075 [Acidithiobacillus thiooxidans]OFC44923.1 hypothetical protein BAE47_11010 [Acidithiobacillus thiooxidans]
MTKKTPTPEKAITAPWDSSAHNWSAPNQYCLSVLRHQLKHAAPDHSPETRPGLMTEAGEGMMRMLAPRDGTETLLCIQAIQAHNNASECLHQAWKTGQPPAVRDAYLNRATKFMRVFREHVEAIDKHRYGGKQQITVTHQTVNVENGGQAVVAGNFDKGGGQG